MTDDIHIKETRVGEERPVITKSLIGSLEKYNIQREIGHGGMAVVYEAIEKSLNRIVALKVLSKEFSQDSELVQRFVNEAQAAARLSHPNIVQIYSIGEEKGVYYFAMEYIRGKSVEDMITEGTKIAVKDSLNIIRQTVVALQEAYKLGIFHRDIKPGNLLLTEQEIVKVADFGLAGEIKSAAGSTGGRVIGTPLYMSPEQAQGKPGDHRSDMYSLGITFYHMLTGNPPFISKDTKELINSQIQKPLPHLPAYIHPSISRLIRKLAEKEPDSRFKDYDSLLAVLDKICDSYTRKRRFGPLVAAGILILTSLFVYNTVRRHKLPEKEKQVEAMYKDVAAYARKYPDSHGEIIKEYSRIMREYPGTEWSLRAEQKVDMIILTVVKEAAEELKEMKARRDKLIAEERYGTAIDEYMVIKARYKDTVAESYAQENINDILERAKHRLQKIKEEAEVNMNEHKFNEARSLFSKVIAVFGIEELKTLAKDELLAIDKKEKEYILEKEAVAVFAPQEKEIGGLLAADKYKEARGLLAGISGVEENQFLHKLIQKELSIIDELEITHEAEVLKEKMESQYALYNRLGGAVGELIKELKFEDAEDIINKEITGVEVAEWRNELDSLLEKVRYLVMVKSVIITGINETLAKRENPAGAVASQEKLILLVEGGFVGISWKEYAPEKIYRLALRYTGKDNAEHHIGLGIFCATFGLFRESEKEFALALRISPDKRDIVEKYMTGIAEG